MSNWKRRADVGPRGQVLGTEGYIVFYGFAPCRALHSLRPVVLVVDEETDGDSLGGDGFEMHCWPFWRMRRRWKNQRRRTISWQRSWERSPWTMTKTTSLRLADRRPHRRFGGVEYVNDYVNDIVFSFLAARLLDGRDLCAGVQSSKPCQRDQEDEAILPARGWRSTSGRTRP